MRNETIEVLSTHPVLLNVVLPSYNIATDWADGDQDMKRILDTHPEPLFLISDIREMRMSLDDMISAASMGSRGDTPAWHHPRMRGLYFVSTSKIVRMAAAGLNNPAFGNVRAKVFGTVEEALADIERVMAAA